MEYLPSAIGIALSPMPIIALIIILFSKRARVNGLAFAVGWIVTIAVTSLLLIVILSGGDVVSTNSDNFKIIIVIIRIALGLFMLYIAFEKFIKRPRNGEKVIMPKWMESVESFGLIQSVGTAILLGTINLKNVPLMIVAVPEILTSTTFGGSSIENWIFFAGISVSSVVLIILVYFLAGKQAKKILRTLKEWLIVNNNLIMCWLFLILGIATLYKGLVYFL